MAQFERPTANIDAQDTFGPREVGLTHPDTSSFVRLRDNGDIEVVAAEGCLIVLSPSNRSITFIADQVKFMTKDSEGFRWNDKHLNPHATHYSQPSLLDMADDEHFNLYRGVEPYTGA